MTPSSGTNKTFTRFTSLLELLNLILILPIPDAGIVLSVLPHFIDVLVGSNVVNSSFIKQVWIIAPESSIKSILLLVLVLVILDCSRYKEVTSVVSSLYSNCYNSSISSAILVLLIALALFLGLFSGNFLKQLDSLWPLYLQ